MTVEVLTVVRSLMTNTSIQDYVGINIVEITTNKRTLYGSFRFTKKFSKKSGYIRQYIDNVIKFCKANNIDYIEYLTVDKVDKLGILPFDYSQEVMHLDIYNID